MSLFYLDFDLQIDELADGSYRARVLNSPAGQAETLFVLPFSDLEIENFFLRIGRPRRGVRRANSPELDEARKFGSKLYDAVFQDDLQSCLLRSLDYVEQQEQGIRLRLRLPPSLIELPWEYLYDTTRNRFLAHSTSTPIVRYLDLPESLRPLIVPPPLKALVVIASPRDYELLDVEAEWQKLKTAVATLEQRGILKLTRLPAEEQTGATLAALQKQLRQEQYHIFHFIGHGGFDQQTQDGVLLFETEDGRSRLVSGNFLGTLLHDEQSLRLAILNACEGARTTKSDPFAGVAQQLVRQGIPAVLAMQFEITDNAAIQLTREFYDALVNGYPVEGALAEARKALFTEEKDIEWGTPVLYLQAVDGHLFDITDQAHNAVTQQNPPSSAQTAAGKVMVYTLAAAAQQAVKRLQPWQVALLLALLLAVSGIALRSLLNRGAANPPAATPSPSIPQTAASTATNTMTPDTPAVSNLNPVSQTLWLVEAETLMNNNDYAAAQRVYERLLAVDPENVEGLLGLGLALRYTEGGAQAALRLLYEAAELQPDNPAVNAALGNLLRETFDRHQDAIPYYSRAISQTVAAQRAPLYGARGWAYQAVGDDEQAIADWNEVIRLDPGNENYFHRAEIYKALGQDRAAIEDYGRAIELLPTDAKYYFYRAEAYARLNQVDEAVSDYDAFLRLQDPSTPPAAIDQAQRYLATHGATPTPS